jgi:2-dehydro-3-deoxygalactonokinase
MSAPVLIAVDWGTSRARAYRVGADGEPLDERAADLGIQRVGAGSFAEAFRQLIGDWQASGLPRLACGMVGSRQGWVEAPYVRCPASLATLADGIVATPDGALAIVPGLITRDAGGMPDVMRGEETQIVGAVAADAPRTLVVLPGTHAKWALVERGTVLDFATFMTGELHETLLAHTILGRFATSAAPARAAGEAAFARGVERGLGAGGFMHDIFGARTHVLAGELAPDEVGEWLSGLLIGREVRTARSWAHRGGHDASRVLIVGGDTLVERYLRVFRNCGIDAMRGPADAAARGLHAIARAAGRIH